MTDALLITSSQAEAYQCYCVPLKRYNGPPGKMTCVNAPVRPLRAGPNFSAPYAGPELYLQRGIAGVA